MSDESVYLPATLTEEEQALLQTGASSSSSSCSSGCSKKKKTVHVDEPNSRYEWIIDDAKKTITLVAKVFLIFNNRPDGEAAAWTDDRIKTVKQEYPKVVEDAWNASAFKFVPKKPKCCPAESYIPKLDIKLTDDQNAYIVGFVNGNTWFSVKEGTNTVPRDFVTDGNSLFNGNAPWKITDSVTDKKFNVSVLMREDGVTERTITGGSPMSSGGCKGRKQIAAAHEFGHSIGLLHPGELLKPPITVSPETYQIDSQSLMGCGTELRFQYFARWRDQLNKHRKTCCGSFLINPVTATS